MNAFSLPDSAMRCGYSYFRLIVKEADGTEGKTHPGHITDEGQSHSDSKAVSVTSGIKCKPHT